jgi:hypothetical protein
VEGLKLDRFQRRKSVQAAARRHQAGGIDVHFGVDTTPRLRHPPMGSPRR